jgi:hypothetical protein
MENLTDVMGNGAPAADQTDLMKAAGGGAGTGSDPEGGSGTGGAGQVKRPAWMAQISKDIAGKPETAEALAGFAKLDDLVKAYMEKRNEAAAPGKDAKPEEVEAFWRKLGKPDKKEGYSIAGEKDAEAWLEAAYGANLTDAQAGALRKALAEAGGRRLEAARAKQEEELAASDAALRREYGDGYGRAVRMFMRGIGNAEGKSSPVSAALQTAGLAGRTEIIRAFIALGESMSENESPAGGAPPRGFKSVRDGGGFSYEKT